MVLQGNEETIQTNKNLEQVEAQIKSQQTSSAQLIQSHQSVIAEFMSRRAQYD